MNFSRSNLIILLTVCTALLVLCPSRSYAGDWPCYRGPDKDGTTTETIDIWPPVEIWRASVGEGYSQAVVSNGKVYTAGWAPSLDTVYCFDEGSTGNDPAPVWTQSYSRASTGYLGGYEGTRATPTVDTAGTYVYMFSHRGQLNAFDRDTGTPALWNPTITTSGRDVEWGFGGSVLIEGNLAIVNAAGGGVAFDKLTGVKVWPAIEIGMAGYATPFAFTDGFAQRTVVIGNKNGAAGIDPADGSVLWTLPLAQLMADPIIFNDQVFISAGYGAGCVKGTITSGTITPDWAVNDNLQTKVNCSVFSGGYIYGIKEDGGGTLNCVNFATGVLEWTGPSFGIESSLMIAGGELIVLSTNGSLVGVELTHTAYNQLHRADGLVSGDTWSCPTLANGKLYIRSHQGTIVCFTAGTPVPRISITIDSDPTGRQINVDGTDYTVPRTFEWIEASDHIIDVSSSPQGLSGARYSYQDWSDGGTQSHTYTTPGAPETITANFSVEYQLTTAVTPAGSGSVTPVDGTWYASGTVISVSAVPNIEWIFDYWSGELSGAVNPQDLTMDAPRSVTAHFTDTDDDGMPDAWEVLWGFNPNDPADAVLDFDGDGLDNLNEYIEGTDPTDIDTDDDGLNDLEDPQKLIPIGAGEQAPSMGGCAADRTPVPLALLSFLLAVSVFILRMKYSRLSGN